MKQTKVFLVEDDNAVNHIDRLERLNGCNCKFELKIHKEQCKSKVVIELIYPINLDNCDTVGTLIALNSDSLFTSIPDGGVVLVNATWRNGKKALIPLLIKKVDDLGEEVDVRIELYNEEEK